MTASPTTPSSAEQPESVDPQYWAEEVRRQDEDPWAEDDRADRSYVPRRRKATGPSLVYSIRLGLDEVAALERRAAIVNLPPTVLARQFVRAGIYAEDDVDGEDETLTTLADRLACDSAALCQLLDSGAR